MFSHFMVESLQKKQRFYPLNPLNPFTFCKRIQRIEQIEPVWLRLGRVGLARLRYKAIVKYDAAAFYIIRGEQK